jgi:thymidylate synthase (FAD)
MQWKAPIFVARQLAKHQVGLSWNEVSRRYVKEKPELFWPKEWRKAAENVKQGSSEELFGSIHTMNTVHRCNDLLWYYNQLVDEGLCPEQARMFLPQNMYTEWVWTGSLYAWARVYKQRTDPHTQKETRDLVLTIDLICSKLYPHSWKALKEN